MSQYLNFIVDFPSRCCQILEDYYGKARGSDLGVTLMLAIATSGFTIPFERIRNTHPSGDSQKFLDAKRKIGSLQKKRFLSSALWDNTDAASWRYVKELDAIQGDPQTWPQLRSAELLPADTKNNTVLRHLRNALAHGNIFSKGDPIEELIFLSRSDEQQERNISVNGTLRYKSDGSGILTAKLDLSKTQPDVPQSNSDKLSLLAVSPSDFYKFLKAWFEFLKTIELPSEVTQEEGSPREDAD